MSRLVRPAYRPETATRGSTPSPDLPPLTESLPLLATRRLLIAGFLYRAFTTPIMLAGLLGEVNGGVRRSLLLSVVVSLSLGNLALATTVARQLTLRLLLNRWFFAFDLAVACLANLWASSHMPEGSLFLQYRDLFWAYAIGTVAIWTAQRGSLVGLGLVLSGIPLQAAMARFNGIELGSIDGVLFITRLLWLVSGFAVAQLVLLLSREGAEVAAAEGLRAGREAGRARLLRTMHDTVLQTLEAIALRAEQDDVATEHRLQEVRKAARKQAADLRTLLRRSAEEPGELYDRLASLVAEFEAHMDAPVEFVQLGEAPTLESEACQALVEAVAEALRNVERHAGAGRVTVLAEKVDGRTRVVIRDDGRGFDPASIRPDAFGIAQSIVARLAEVGGGARVESAPAAGTRLELWVPGSPRGAGIGVSAPVSRRWWSIWSRA